MIHEPVLLEPLIERMAWSEPVEVADLTVGGAGHLKALLMHCDIKPSRIVANDQDSFALGKAKEALKEFEPIEWCHGNFRILVPENIGQFDRVIVDLGVSSFQLDSGERGFSFQKEGPLDMRMNPEEGEPVWSWLEHCREQELADIIWKYGEERRSRKFARQWCHGGQGKGIKTTQDFVGFFGYRLDSKDHHGRHPLTRVFQALRIFINDEFGALEELLEHLPRLLKPEGRVAIITFHSLEDRAVKWGLRGKLDPINKKVVQAEEEERLRNPRSRSAKLRVYERNAA